MTKEREPNVEMEERISILEARGDDGEIDSILARFDFKINGLIASEYVDVRLTNSIDKNSSLDDMIFHLKNSASGRFFDDMPKRAMEKIRKKMQKYESKDLYIFEPDYKIRRLWGRLALMELGLWDKVVDYIYNECEPLHIAIFEDSKIWFLGDELFEKVTKALNIDVHKVAKLAREIEKNNPNSNFV